MTERRLRIAVVEDEAAHAEAIRRAFLEAGIPAEILVAGTLREFRAMVEREPPDIALLDLDLPDGRALELLTAPPEVAGFPAVIMTSHGGEQIAVEALKAGALDYVVKSAESFSTVPRIVERTLREWEALRARRRSDARFHNLFDNMAEGVALHELVVAADGTPADYRILEVNRAYADQTGIPAERARGEMASRLYGSGAPPFLDTYAPVVASGQPVTFEASFDPLGRTFRISAFRSEPGVFATVFEDVTERRHAGEELAASLALLRIACETARFGGWSVDLGTGVCTWSDAVADIHEVPRGFAPKVEEGIAFYAPKWRERITAVFTACAEDGVPYDEEMEIITGAGRRAWVRTTGQAVRDESGRIVSVQGSFQDITERKRAEQERQYLQKQLQESQKLESVGQLAGGVAHDFNNLLSVIVSYSDFAAGALREGDPARADVLEIRKAGERAATLTRQLLAFSRKQIMEPRVLDLNRVVGDIESLLRRLLGEGIEIAFRPAEGLGSVLADPGQLEQVLVNLAVNARDAMPGGGGLIIETANVELDEDYAARHASVLPGRYVRLSVTDTGSGMDATVKERLFEPFFTTKEVGKGTGLGLATCYGIVKQSGGNIRVYSEPGQGTTFKIYLPRTDAPATGPVRRSPVVAVRGTETVLLVEDEEVVRVLAARILRSAGYEVLSAGSGAEALALFEEHGSDIDLLLTDVVMPRVSGRELAERLATLRPGLRVLYMSGYADDAIVHHGVLDPGTHFVGKPFSSADLTRKVREVLDAPGEG